MMFAVCAALSALADIPRFTANYYLADREKYEGQVVTVYVDSVSTWKVSFDSAVLKDYYPYTVYTAYKGERGGSMYCLVHKSKNKNFSRHYGNKSQYKKNMNGDLVLKSKSLKAQFYKWEFNGGHEWVLIVK
jgi:hypothetical protein